jgi:hypothetical protein
MESRNLALRRLIASIAFLFAVSDGMAQAQTGAPTPAPADVQPEATDHSSHAGMGGMGMGGKSGMSHGCRGMMMHMMCAFTDHLEPRLAYLKTELKITAQQSPQWDTFADAWRAVAQKASPKCAAGESGQTEVKPGVLGDLSTMETHMVDHLEIVRAQKAAIESLFTVLTDDQKKAANETLRRLMKVGMPMGGGSMSDMDGMQHRAQGMDGKDSTQHGGGHTGGMGMGGMRHGKGMGGMHGMHHR